MVRKSIAALAVGLVCSCSMARAADVPAFHSPVVAAYDWTGFYLGGHVGYVARQCRRDRDRCHSNA